MKICKIYIKGFQQFQDTELDFTNPETGQPVDKICFIGSNGTGKSTILRLINWFLIFGMKEFRGDKKIRIQYNIPDDAILIFKINDKDSNFFFFYFGLNVVIQKMSLSPADEKSMVRDLFSSSFEKAFNQIGIYESLPISGSRAEFIESLSLKDNANDILVYSPSETPVAASFTEDGVPHASVNGSLTLSQNLPYLAIVREDKLDDFWSLLICHLRKREEDRKTFEERPENLVKIKGELIKGFDAQNPRILNQLSGVWDKILRKTGLEFDLDGANNPYQLTDNLKAYIRLKKSGKRINYSELSTGIRNFIFRLGHIYSLYFNREIDKGFLLVDEPENSLYPDFLFDLVETYNEVIIDKRGQNNTQMFFATHNPIIAAQFEPYERVILDWNEDGSVAARKGVSPAGDDPNDILTNDFELTDLMGPEGKKQWEKYVDLKKTLIRATDKDEKMKLAKEINHIGQQYNFPA